MGVLKDFFNYIINQFAGVAVTDVLDVLIVSVIFYYIIVFIRDRRAGKLAVGIFLLFAVLGISALLRLNVLAFILGNILQVGLLAVFIIFQPEIRSMLEKVGNESFKNLTLRENTDESETKKSIEALCTAAQELAATKTGALIVIERGTKLGDNIKTGVIVNADINVFLLKNIFFNKAPLHDGAVIIRDNRIYACGCFLPLSYNANIIRNIGTRHRAAIGMSENSDALVIVVSEETGTISVAKGGKLSRGFDMYSLKSELENELIDKEKSPHKMKIKLPKSDKSK